MTPTKRWPNNAEWARTDSIARLEKEIGSLVEIVDKDLTQIEMLRRLGKTIDGLRQVQNWLREAGNR